MEGYEERFKRAAGSNVANCLEELKAGRSLSCTFPVLVGPYPDGLYTVTVQKARRS